MEESVQFIFVRLDGIGKPVKPGSPKILGSRYTIPQRLTVAGEATARSCTSNMIVITWEGRKRLDLP